MILQNSPHVVCVHSDRVRQMGMVIVVPSMCRMISTMGSMAAAAAESSVPLLGTTLGIFFVVATAIAIAIAIQLPMC